MREFQDRTSGPFLKGELNMQFTNCLKVSFFRWVPRQLWEHMMRFPTGQAESSVPQVGTFQIEISHLQSQHARILIGITYVTYTYRQRERERESDISTAYSFVFDWDPIYILTRWCTPTYPTCVVGHINPPEVLNFRRRLEVHALERSIHLRPQSHRAPRGGLKSSEDFIILEPQKQTWMGSCIQQTL